jgi:pyridoxine/pyridoxamine 5'-phosphate oxidase
VLGVPHGLLTRLTGRVNHHLGGQISLAWMRRSWHLHIVRWHASQSKKIYDGVALIDRVLAVNNMGSKQIAPIVAVWRTFLRQSGIGAVICPNTYIRILESKTGLHPT